MRQLSWEDIYRYYLGNITIGDMYNSPIPMRNDRTPSFQLYERNGKVHWVDHGLADQFGRDPENLVQYLRYLPLTTKGYFAAKDVIQTEVTVGMIGEPLTQLARKPGRTSVPYLQDGEWRDYEIAYWARFDIQVSELEEEDISPVRAFSWSGAGGKTHIESTPTEPAFVYWWNRHPASWKLYRPLSRKRDRFRQENVDGVIEGWNSMMSAHQTKFRILFILSSTKDRMVVKHCYGDPMLYNGINARGEKDRQDIILRKDEISELADRVIILYDADDPGYNGARMLAHETGFEFYDTRNRIGGQKDFADYVDTERGNHTHDELRTLINNIIV